MKSKNPDMFWRRWIAVSGLHAIFYTWFWMNNGWLFVNSYNFVLLNFMSGIVLAGLHYWAMPFMMRPNAKRWFLISILAHALAVTIHSIVIQSSFPNPNPLALWLSLFLLPALAQAWALSEHFKKAQLFALASFLPALLLFVQFPIREVYQNYALFEIVVQVLRTSLMGLSLIYLQRYQRKEETALQQSHKRLELQDNDEEAQEAEARFYAQQKQS